MIRLITVAIVALFGDPTYLMRVWVSLVLGASFVVLGYWLAAPVVLPMWPGVVAVLVAAAVGVGWEIQAENARKSIR